MNDEIQNNWQDNLLHICIILASVFYAGFTPMFPNGGIWEMPENATAVFLICLLIAMLIYFSTYYAFKPKVGLEEFLLGMCFAIISFWLAIFIPGTIFEYFPHTNFFMFCLYILLGAPSFMYILSFVSRKAFNVSTIFLVLVSVAGFCCALS